MSNHSDDDNNEIDISAFKNHKKPTFESEKVEEETNPENK